MEGVRAGAGQGLAQGATNILDRFLNRLPTITIRAGHRLRIWLTSDVLCAASRLDRAGVKRRPIPAVRPQRAGCVTRRAAAERRTAQPLTRPERGGIRAFQEKERTDAKDDPVDDRTTRPPHVDHHRVRDFRHPRRGGAGAARHHHRQSRHPDRPCRERLEPRHRAVQQAQTAVRPLAGASSRRNRRADHTLDRDRGAARSTGRSRAVLARRTSPTPTRPGLVDALDLFSNDRHAADGLLARPLGRRARRHRTTGPDRVQHAPRGARRPRGGELPPRRRSRRTPDGCESHRQRRRSVGNVHGEIGARITSPRCADKPTPPAPRSSKPRWPASSPTGK